MTDYATSRMTRMTLDTQETAGSRILPRPVFYRGQPNRKLFCLATSRIPVAVTRLVDEVTVLQTVCEMGPPAVASVRSCSLSGRVAVTS